VHLKTMAKLPDVEADVSDDSFKKKLFYQFPSLFRHGLRLVIGKKSKILDATHKRDMRLLELWEMIGEFGRHVAYNKEQVNYLDAATPLEREYGHMTLKELSEKPTLKKKFQKATKARKAALKAITELVSKSVDKKAKLEDQINLPDQMRTDVMKFFDEKGTLKKDVDDSQTVENLLMPSIMYVAKDIGKNWWIRFLQEPKSPSFNEWLAGKKGQMFKKWFLSNVDGWSSVDVLKKSMGGEDLLSRLRGKTAHIDYANELDLEFGSGNALMMPGGDGGAVAGYPWSNQQTGYAFSNARPGAYGYGYGYGHGLNVIAADRQNIQLELMVGLFALLVLCVVCVAGAVFGGLVTWIVTKAQRARARKDAFVNDGAIMQDEWRSEPAEHV